MSWWPCWPATSMTRWLANRLARWRRDTPTCLRAARDQERRRSERILPAVIGAQPLIRSEATASEEARRLTPAVVGALRQAGVFRMTTPREHGGPDSR